MLAGVVGPSVADRVAFGGEDHLQCAVATHAVPEVLRSASAGDDAHECFDLTESSGLDLKEGLLRENDAWASTFSLPAAQHLISGALQEGAQTPAGERDLEGLMRSVARFRP
ncbi:hypothetical protein ACIQB5_23950 [Streptomyces sp. NPDC088560]|uniref:hypothetical protein n=1 Tax=Streptomyces sp. NPDC088560 TaxID=3365868 RepID=UPI00380D0F10